MNESERSELDWLKQRHSRLEQELSMLAKQLDLLEKRLSADAPAIRVPTPIPPPKPETPAQPGQPPPVRDLQRPTPVPTVAAPPVIRAAASAMPPAAHAIPPCSPASQAPPPPAAPSQIRPSFEMRLGTYWLVRIGIVMLLTGLVFFGNYAYQNFIGRLGASGKVSLLYLASAVLLGGGAWWQRKASTEALRNYGQVLFAGGLAAVYFTTYAAHHFEHLQVIQSPLLDGALLFAWAGFMAWIADRKKSEVLALFAVGLAYYTSVITRVGSFTLYSNLVLTLAAVFFLVRNRWAALSFASLAATYASYAFWRFFHGGEWRWTTPDEGLWFGAFFLISYWLVFTAAVFLSKHEQFTGRNRASFLTLNNGAFFTMFLLTMLQAHPGGFWKFSSSYGVVLLALAVFAGRLFATEPIVRNSCLTQGLLLVTVGIISKFIDTNRTLALVLGAESIVLLVLGLARRGAILQIGGYLCGALAVGWGIDALEKFDRAGLYTGAALGAFMAFNAYWAARQSPASKSSLRPVPSYFTLLALLMWAFSTWQNTASVQLPLAFIVEAALLTVSIYVLRVREFALLGQIYLVLGHLAWQYDTQWHGAPSWWNPLVMIAVTLGLGHWWPRQRIMEPGAAVRAAGQLVCALALIGVLYVWLEGNTEAPTRLVLWSGLALVVTAYGVQTRAWLLAACGQIFSVAAAWQFAWQMVRAKPEGPFALAPVAALGVLSFATVKWFEHKPDSSTTVRDPLLQFALIYRWVALAMSVWWVCEYVPERQRIWTLTALGLLVFLFAGWRRNREALLFGAAFTLTGLAMFWLPPDRNGLVYAPNALAILVFTAQQQTARRFASRYALDERLHAAVIVIGGLCLWRFVSKWVVLDAGESYLTASWSALALALFACGVLLRERMYRWCGLAVLAVALAWVLVFDVWKLEMLYRILSFMALGVVLLLLGFIYNKYQEKIRQWL